MDELQEYENIHYTLVNFIENSENPNDDVLDFFNSFSHRLNRGITRTFLMTIKNVDSLKGIFLIIKEKHDSLKKNKL